MARPAAVVKAELDETMQHIAEALDSEAKPSRAGVKYLMELRARASALGAEIAAGVNQQRGGNTHVSSF